jgi:hypothetical protein
MIINATEYNDGDGRGIIGISDKDIAEHSHNTGEPVATEIVFNGSSYLQWSYIPQVDGTKISFSRYINPQTSRIIR